MRVANLFYCRTCCLPMIQSKKWVLRYQLYSHDEYALACFASSIISGVTYLKYTCIFLILKELQEEEATKKKSEREKDISKKHEGKEKYNFYEHSIYINNLGWLSPRSRAFYTRVMVIIRGSWEHGNNWMKDNHCHPRFHLPPSR